MRRRDDPAAGVNHRTLSVEHHLRGATDLPGVTFGEDLVARKVDAVDVRVVRLCLKDVLGDVDEHRPGAARRSDMKCLVDRLRQIGDVLDQEIVFGAGRVIPNVSAS